MNDSLENIDLFDAYQSGSLSAEEVQNFEKRLSEDQAFAEEYQLYTSSIQVIKNVAFREEVKIHFESEKKPYDHQINPYWLSGIAASLVLLGTIIFWPSEPSNTDLFDTYYSSYPNVLSVRGEDSTDGFQSYTAGDFEQAISQFKNAGLSNDTINFYLGLSYIETSQHEHARKTLQHIDTTSMFHQQKTWYLGLLLIHEGDHEEAKQTLNQIPKGEFNYELAQELVKKLD